MTDLTELHVFLLKLFKERYPRTGIQSIILFFSCMVKHNEERLHTAKCPEFCCKSCQKFKKIRKKNTSPVGLKLTSC